MRGYLVQNFSLDGWYEPNTENPKFDDIEEAKAAMNFIGDIIDKEFRLDKPLDTDRFGGDSPAQPEARFEFTEGDQKKMSVIEIKNFPFEEDERKASLLFTQRPLYKWFKDFHHKHADEDHRIIFQLKIKGDKIDPKKALYDLEQSDPFVGVITDYFELTAVKWHRSQEFILQNGVALDYTFSEGNFLVIEETSSPLDVDMIIKDSINYEHYVDLLYNIWIKKDWDKKFKQYEEDSKYLYLKIILSPARQLAVLSGDFSVEEFFNTLIIKYGTTKSISQLQGILIFAAGTYQFLELRKNERVLYSANEQYKPKLAAPFA